MIYENICSGIFLSRPNRFIAQVEINGRIETCHVKNTGRCAELLIPGVTVMVQQVDSPGRLTGYDLISVWKGDRLINMDSAVPNKIFAEYLRSGQYIKGLTLIKPETGFGNSRFDFYLEAGERKIFIEVKGVTLEEDGVALFPDAPTERGVKHLRELIRCLDAGFEAQAVFIIQMKGLRYFTPNVRTHAAFDEALKAANKAGVTVRAMDCWVGDNRIAVADPVPVKL
ncbi:DNA/RNA nuclease SfsA [Acetonema longum]|nr:DNA/RNA nuclease SfsA [Acetonema longum]